MAAQSNAGIRANELFTTWREIMSYWPRPLIIGERAARAQCLVLSIEIFDITRNVPKHERASALLCNLLVVWPYYALKGWLLRNLLGVWP
jgi:hypothetical protein